jgi:hypothetical protein
MTPNVIQQGDKCWVQLNKKHYGICTGYGADGEPWFVHNTRNRGAVHETRKGFAGNRPIYIEQRAPHGQGGTVAARALELLGRDYDMLFFNCEHLANFAINGEAESKQVQQGVLLTALSAVVVGVVATIANENGTSIDANGYRRDASGRFGARRWW